MKKNIPSSIATIHGLSHEGRGITSHENKTTFIAGALPTETVSYRITQKRGSFNEATLLAVETPSADRVEPPCQHFGLCGGCNLQHMHDNLQLSFKQQTLLDQLQHFGQVKPQHILEPLQAQSLGYRRKARLGAKYVIKKEQVFVGFREKASSYLADLSSCVVLHPQVGEKFLLLRELIASLESYRHIAQIEIAIGDSDAALVFRHMQPLSDVDKEKLMHFGETHHFHIYLQPNPPEAVSKLWPADNYQRLRYTLPEYGLEYLFHPMDFTQINLEMNRLMVKQAMDLLDVKANENVLDLFCGIGNFTLPLAKSAQHVTGIEGSEEMVQRAYENAAHNQISNVSFHAANLMAEVKAPWAEKTYDKILLDPPRAGAKEMLALIARTKAKRLVYVSCNPATLARDAGELVHQHGYQLTHAGIMNMFPHTAHIEAMAVFEKK